MAARATESRLEWLVLAAVVTAAAAAVPPYVAAWAHASLSWLGAVWLDQHLGRDEFDALFALAFGTVLVLPNPARAGLVVPRTGWGRSAALAVAVLAGVTGLDRRVDLPLLRGDGPGVATWLTLAVAADLVFAGYLFAAFDRLWPRPLQRWLPVRPAVVLTAAYAAAFQAQFFQSADPAAVRVQVLAFGIGGLLLGLTRQWTGSVLFVVLAHVAAGWMVWHDIGWPG